MGVISIKELLSPDSNAATWSLQDGKLDHSYTRMFLVMTDSISTLAHQVLSAHGFTGAVWPAMAAIPSLGSYYQPGASGELDTFAICTSIAAKRIEQSLGWLVTHQYQTVNPNFNNLDPTTNHPRVSWSSVPYEKICDWDIYGDPVLTTSFERFDPPITKDAKRPVLKVSRTELTFDHQLAGDLESVVNSDPFADYDPGMVKVADISAQDRYDPILGQIWDVEYTFEINVEGWTKRELSVGFKQLHTADDGTITQVNIKDKNGENIQTPALLDENGIQVPPAGTPYFLNFVVYDSISFADVFNFANINFGTPTGDGLPALPDLPVALPTLPTPDDRAGPVEPSTPVEPSHPEQ